MIAYVAAALVAATAAYAAAVARRRAVRRRTLRLLKELSERGFSGSGRSQAIGDRT